MGITPDDYLMMLQALLPPGRAWTRETGADLTRLLKSEADGLVRVEERIDDLLDESIPSSALEMLPEWEEGVGLPDSCSANYDNVQDRRNAVGARLVEIGDQSISFYKALAARLGISIDIKEWRPFRAGMSSMGDHVGDDTWMFVWEVIADVVPDCDITTVEGSPVQADGGASGGSFVPSFISEVYYGDAPASVPDGLSAHTYRGHKLLECTIRAMSPTHTYVFFTYPGEA